MKHYFLLYSCILCAFLSCCKKNPEVIQHSETLIIYMAADNNLKSNALLNVYDMVEGIGPDQKVIVFFDKGDKSSYLMEINKKNGVSIHQQVVKQYSDMNSASSSTLHFILKEVIKRYPSEQYGLILWSHGTSWFPSSKPQTKSFGIDKGATIEINDLANALPTKFKYILFDACLMGSVEVASELQNHTDYLLASPTDILKTGMPYKEILPILLNYSQTVKARLVEVCKTYIAHYKQNKGELQSATIALYDLNNIELVQHTMSEIITDYPKVKIGAEGVQRLHKEADCYDLVDAIEKSYGEDSAIKMIKTLNSFILYTDHTDRFQQSLLLKRFHGISCYIPVDKKTYFPDFYSALYWSRITHYNEAIFP
ncbi:hypothetical protein K4L44_10550 [Halosquirtibacter laminarini]|uniref:Uncharacterized protein n=1 Tax=Halosquirtibacter laminarini TaxID=3374600 RepID=A0AC61NC28_9BACT|nr:hypothetical protein K4L44_10550 [Prolixibacteraceae bacterium]